MATKPGGSSFRKGSSVPLPSHSSLSAELGRLLDVEDGRTLIAMREAEPHYDVIAEKAEYDGKGTTVTFDGGLTTYLTGREVKVGDTLTFWDGRNQPLMGGERHGWAHNGELVEWITPFERVAKRVAWLAKYDRDKRERLERGAEKRARDYDRLPVALKARIDRFAAEREDFWLHGDYELFCCTEAVKIVDYLRPQVEAGQDAADAVKVFYDLPWDEQVKAGVDDGHSGNTFGGACSLARSLLTGEKV